MPTPRKRALAVAGTVSLAGLLLASCTTDTGAVGEAADGDATATVVATTTQMGSLAEQVTECAGGATQILMSPSDDPHQFEASSAQIVDMIQADLVVSNGLGLESAMQRSIDNAVTDGAEVVELAPELDPLPVSADDQHDHGEETHDHAEHEHDHGEYDAHVWMDVSRMADGAELLGEEIAAATGDDTYVSCGTEVAEELRDVDAEIAEIMAELDAPRLVTDHAAYNYFADRYGVEITGVVIPGGSTDAEPSSQDLAALAKVLNDQEADALVTSKANTNRLVTALAGETNGAVPVVELYENAVGEPGSDAETYQDAMLYNANAMADAIN